MNLPLRFGILLAGGIITLAACSSSDEASRTVFEPQEVIDLGALVTEDLPRRVSGQAFLNEMGFTRPNAFDVIRWEFEMPDGRVSGSNAYYTLFNHGGPHVDAPNHVSVGGGLDSYPIEAFAGPLRVFDVRQFPVGRSVPADVFRGAVSPGDVVLIFTGYAPPTSDEALPETLRSRAQRPSTWQAYPSGPTAPTPSVSQASTIPPRSTQIPRSRKPCQFIIRSCRAASPSMSSSSTSADSSIDQPPRRCISLVCR